LSQSGETADVKKVVSNAIEEGFTTLGVVNVVGSVVARMVKMGVYCHAGNENGVASTKSFTSQITILALISLWFRELQDRLNGTVSPSVETERLKDALLRLPISLGMALKTREQCQKIAKRLSKNQHCFVLGKGTCFRFYQARRTSSSRPFV
jgi:glucosamine--fructose-6-phosphate aminotransferase (isomerizing)